MQEEMALLGCWYSAQGLRALATVAAFISVLGRLQMAVEVAFSLRLEAVRVDRAEMFVFFLAEVPCTQVDS
jgi:hypothetical protein